MSDEKDNLIVIDGGKTPNVTAEAVRLMDTNMPHLLEYMVMTAKLHRAKYVALKEAGFSNAEALMLCQRIY